MRSVNWFKLTAVALAAILVLAAACKTNAQYLDEKARERMPSLVGITVSPIQAVFDQKTFSTTYRVEVGGEPDNTFFRAEWSRPDCGNWSEVRGKEENIPMFSSTHEFKWYHPHPPCPETTNHEHVDVKLVLTQIKEEEINGKLSFKETGIVIVCTYHGSESGTGAKPVWQEK